MNILSIFDGVSCGQIAVNTVGIEIDNYFASEIDKYAISITQKNYPNTIQLGDALNWQTWELPKIDLMLAGSPCTFWSLAKNNREIDKSGIGWKLFMCFVGALRKHKPKYFLYENVASMPNTIKSYITEEFEIDPIEIDSALVSGQSRKRYYWTNILSEPTGLFGFLKSQIPQPKDKGILLKDILESGLVDKEKSGTITASYYKIGENPFSEFGSENGRQRVFEHSLKNSQRSMIEPFIHQRPHGFNSGGIKKDKSPTITANGDWQDNNLVINPIRLGDIRMNTQGYRVYSVKGKSITLSANGGGLGAKTGLYKIDLPDGDYIIRKLTPVECEKLQTMPDDYTAFGIDVNGKEVKISNSQRYKCIGNCWTVDVVAHILNHICS